MSLRMTRAEREAFLAGVHVGILAVDEPGRGPMTVPVWYAYEPGGPIRFTTSEDSAKAPLLRAAGRASLCVQEEKPPYSYVAVEGGLAFAVPDFERDIRAIAVRYLGERGGEAYLRTTGGGDSVRGSLLVSLQPERWRTVDYGK
jgi:nitroimidazol reductase NimA-like FMN-containing flavoprotein (pyridoxamine 5'-phosphate oxidase superfamily)